MEITVSLVRAGDVAAAIGAARRLDTAQTTARREPFLLAGIM